MFRSTAGWATTRTTPAPACACPCMAPSATSTAPTTRSTWRRALDAGGYHDIAWGSSYIQTVTFDDAGPVAQAMLVYGQSVDPTSPHYADQLPLFSRKEWPALPFTPEQIKADPHYQLTTLSE